MFSEIVKRSRPSVFAEIARRGDKLELRRGEASGDQGGILQHAKAGRHVDAFLDQVDIAVGEGEAEPDVRILGLKGLQPRHDLQPAERYRHVHAQIARRFEPRLLEHQLRFLEVGQRLAATFEKRRAILGQADPSRGTRQEPGPGLLLQPLDGVAYARLGDAEIDSGAHEALTLRHLHEDRQCPQVGHSSIYHYK